jgi:hypothetical protein
MKKGIKNYVGVAMVIAALAVLMLLGSCATLSREQIGAVEKFGNNCDSFKRYPSLLFEEIAEIRMERGLLYAATLQDPENRVEELEAIHDTYRQDLTLATKTDKSLEILRTYSKALRVLIGKGRWQSRGREFRSLGRALDSLVQQANKLQLFREELPEGVGKSAGVIAAYGAEHLMRNKQLRLTRKFIAESDTLVAVLSSQLVEVLRMPHVSAVIENEKTGVRTNYTNFLRATSLATAGSAASPAVTTEQDREFLELYERARRLTYSRGYIISATNRLAKAHKAIVLSMEKGKSAEELYDSLLAFADAISKIEKEFK